MDNLIFSFLDVPALSLNKALLLDFFDTYSTPFLSEKTRLYTNNLDDALWKGVTVYVPKELESSVDPTAGNGYVKFNNLQNEFNSIFPEFNEYLKLLPFNHYYRLQIWEQRKMVPPHKDGGPDDAKYFPLKIRTMLLNENTEPTFYILDDKEQKFPKWNEASSNTFLFNNHKCQHGALLGNKRKLLLIVSGHVDVIRFNDLVTKSLEKYKQLAFFKSRP